MNKIFILIMLLISVTQLKAQDSGGMGSGGGYVYCAEYQDMVGRIASALVTVGQGTVDGTNKVIRVNDLWSIKKVLTCLPVVELDRQARSNPTSKHTDLLIQVFNGIIPWQNLSKTEQMRLAAHELAVLAGYENDGEYFISSDMISILKRYSSQFKLIDVTADQIFTSADGSVTLYRPYVVGPDGEKYYVGNEYSPNQDYYPITNSNTFAICKHFFGYAHTAPGKVTEASYGPGQKFSEITDGHIGGLWTIHSAPGYYIKYFQTVTCTF